MSYQGFGRDSGPASSGNPNPFANLPQKPSPAPPLARFPSQSPTRGNGQNYLYNDYDAQDYEGPPAVMPFTAPSNFTPGFPARASQVQDIRSTRSPPSMYSNGEVLRNSKSIRISRAGFLPKSHNHLSPEQNQSSSLSFQRNSSKDEAQLSGLTSPMWSGQPNPMSNFTTPQSQPVISSVPTPVTSDPRRRSPVQYGDIQIPVTNDPRRRSPVLYGDLQIPVPNDSRRRSPVQYGDLQIPVANDPRGRSPVQYGDLQIPVANDPRGRSPVQYGDLQIPVTNDPRRRFPVQYGDVQVPKRSRSPTFSSGNGGSSEDTVRALENSRRPSTSPPKMRLSNDYVSLGSQSHQQSSTSGHINKVEVAVNKPMSSPVAKKTKLPSSSSYDQVFEETSKSLEDEANRELQAKAKRFIRFKDELSRQTESDLFKNQRAPVKRQQPVIMEKKKLNGEDAADVMGDSFNGDEHPAEYENSLSSGVTVGLCLDMCPESERGERERKGDLDQFERLDGDRNQTSKSLAVKKYNRTAEREAEMIRPMPILQKTMDYLLNLLNQPYDDRFLSLYNFLWDRMRAIRMDLRMQHIFGVGAIKMLEQMIRLHIVAMHELCEYTKGEGFSEGFDAHLNIEQMNKTSVELFQLYDDHRKKGTNVVTEKEFRGYYALLKLDKHPGYKVEPAELSLDLAKMTPGIRQTPEVMFARDVARACRTCNYIAFFNLARKASYLQACLMHAHFAKLRTQALAALHCGLQNNQGIPIVHVAEWLGMEEENIEDLLEYHGLSIKEFEVPYMVKEGLFLNVDNDYPVKCSKLVNKKKSGSIFEDVSYPCLAKWSPEEAKLHDLNKGIKQKPTHVQPIEVDNLILVNDEDMLDYFPSPKDDMQVALTPETSVTQRVTFPASPPLLVPSTFTDSPSSRRNRVGTEEKSKYEMLFRNSFGRNEQIESGVTPLQIMPRKVGEANVALQPIYTVLRNSVPEHPTIEESGEEHINHIEEVMVDKVASTSYDQEVAEAKLKLILRIWKRLMLRRRELREQKQLAANAALNSLSLGPPIWHLDKSRSSGDFEIDRVISKRGEIREKSLSRLNVSEVVASKLSDKNPDAKCLCWKILLLTQDGTNGDNLGKGEEISHFAAGSWLLSKLLPGSYNDDDTGGLAVSSPGLSIWKKWLPSQSGDDAICCLTIIKDVKLGNLVDAVTGASAIIFPVSDCIPWELQRNQLHNVLTALPIDSSLPLLVVSGLCKDDLDSSSIIEELRLRDIDESLISNFLVSFLKGHQMDQFNGFYSDEQLREGLQWLAGESPSQPLVCRIKTRELVLFHLNSSLEALDDMNAHQLGPNECISAFNEALDQSLRKVAAAVHANPSSWPCPEVCLLEESSDEWRAVSMYLPSIGWSSAARIEPLFRALCDFRLPHFVDDIQWLNRGSSTVDDIIKTRSQLESCLIRYLAESSQMMSLPWAMQEAGIMIQKFTQLELHNSAYYIIPKWVTIFQRICHWRLMNLCSGIISASYMLVQDDVSMSTSAVGHKVERIMPLPYLVHPSLDEMVATGYNPLASETFDVDSGALQPYSEVFSSDGHEESKPVTKGSVEDDGNNVEHHSIVVAKHDVTTNESSNVSEFSLAAKTASAEDKLRQLLDRCNLVQSMIQEKLSIYF